jgi:hypothetical protein
MREEKRFHALRPSSSEQYVEKRPVKVSHYKQALSGSMLWHGNLTRPAVGIMTGQVAAVNLSLVVLIRPTPALGGTSWKQVSLGYRD